MRVTPLEDMWVSDLRSELKMFGVERPSLHEPQFRSRLQSLGAAYKHFEKYAGDLASCLHNSLVRHACPSVPVQGHNIKKLTRLILCAQAVACMLWYAAYGCTLQLCSMLICLVFFIHTDVVSAVLLISLFGNYFSCEDRKDRNECKFIRFQQMTSPLSNALCMIAQFGRQQWTTCKCGCWRHKL